MKDKKTNRSKNKSGISGKARGGASLFAKLASNESDAIKTNPKREKAIYMVKVFVAAVIIIFLGCWVRSPDRQIIQNAEGYETWVSESGLPYFLDPDSYYHVRISEGVAKEGHFGTTLSEDLLSTNLNGEDEIIAEAGSNWDLLRDAPVGSDTAYTPAIVYVAAVLYRISCLFGGPDLLWIDFWLPCFFVALTVPVAWLFTRRAYVAITRQTDGADAAGATGAILVTCAPAFVSRTLNGNFETDMPQAMFMMLLMLFMTETMRSKTMKRSVLCAVGFCISTLLYIRFWSASALALAGVAAIGGGIYVLSLLFAKDDYSGLEDKNAGKSGNSRADMANNKRIGNRLLQWISRTQVRMYLAIGSVVLVFLVTPKGRPYLSSIIEKIESYLPGHYSQELNAFNSISELAKPSFGPSFFPHWFLGHLRDQSMTVVNGCGGILMIVAAIACLVVLIVMAIKDRRAGRQRGDGNVYLFVLGSWFVITFITCRLGMRMIQHFAFACAVLVAIFAGLMIGEMRQKWENQNFKDAFMTIAVSAFLFLTMLFSVQGAIGTYMGMRGIISDSNAAAMDWIKGNSESEDAVVMSWWDLGYFYEFESDHPVLWDGGGQDPVKMMTVSRLLSTDDARLSKALMQMLCTYGTKPVTALTDKLGENDGYEALWKLAVMDKEEAVNALTSDYGFNNDQAKRLESWIHPKDPREIYLVLTARMLGQLGWFEYYGNWDFEGDNIAPANTSYAVTYDGSADFQSEDPNVREYFQKRSREMLMRLGIGKDGVADESSKTGMMFDLVFEQADAQDSVQIWRVN